MWWSKSGIGARLGRLSLDVVVSWFMKLWLIGLVPYLVMRGLHFYDAGNYFEAKDSFVIAGGAIIAFLVSLAPSFLARNTHITLPWELDFFVTLLLYLHVALGGAAGWYYTNWTIPYDKVLHLFGSVMIALLAFMFIFTLYYTRRIRLSYTWLFIFIVTAAMALGAIWEILEFGLDQIVGSNAQSGLEDTMWDMIMDLSGGFLAAILGTLYARYSKPKHQRRIAIPIAQLLGHLPAPRGPKTEKDPLTRSIDYRDDDEKQKEEDTEP
jgi:signal transduction histidine kinase